MKVFYIYKYLKHKLVIFTKSTRKFYLISKGEIDVVRACEVCNSSICWWNKSSSTSFGNFSLHSDLMFFMHRRLKNIVQKSLCTWFLHYTCHNTTHYVNIYFTLQCCNNQFYVTVTRYVMSIFTYLLKYQWLNISLQYLSTML